MRKGCRLGPGKVGTTPGGESPAAGRRFFFARLIAVGLALNKTERSSVSLI